jgi:hypothetical protein
MTDRESESAAYYMYRGATNPGRPALLFMTCGYTCKVADPLEENGLAMFIMNDSQESTKNIPDSEPEGVPMKSLDLNKLPKYVKTLKCNNKLGGKESCFRNKWSCTSHMQDEGVDCTCPNVGKRSSWHMG